MQPRDLGSLLLLGALWGASFLFIRYAAPAFGVVPLIWLRVAIASAVLLPLLVWRGQWPELRQRAGPLAIMGLFNSAFPFLFIAWATLSITAGLASILNASTPILTALVGALWLKDRLSRPRALGLLIGFAGVLVLAADQADFKPGGSGWALLAMLAATTCYGFAANYTKRYLGGVSPLANATGSQLVAVPVLLPLAWLNWPAQTPPLGPWMAVVGLGLACTALAYLIFFRLIARVGATRAVTVTFLVPVFGTLWGGLFLHESLTWSMLGGGAVVLLGTALATGLLGAPVAVKRV